MKVMNLLSMVLCAMLLVGCQDMGDGRYVIDYIPYEDNENGGYGLWGSDGSILKTAMQFDDAPSPVVNGYFHYEDEDGFMQIYKVEDGRCVVKHWLDSLQFVGIMNDERIPVCEYRKPIKVLDENGKEVFTLDKINSEEVRGCYSYSCERMLVMLYSGKLLYVDPQGRPLFGETYDFASDFVRGYAVVCLDKDDDEFAVIDVDGNTVFTFNCNNTDYLKFSPRYERLATIDDDGRVIIYNFRGEIVNTYPNKVESVYALCEDCFVFENGDEEYGLMAYTGEELIRAKYDQLIPNGKYFLALHPDDYEDVRLINKDGQQLATLDGEEICDLITHGYEFPNMICRADNELYLVDGIGEILGMGAHDFEFDIDDVTNAATVESDYFPEAKILSQVMDLCGNGSGISEAQGVFFNNNGKHCLPTDIAFIANSPSIAKYSDKKSAYESLIQSVNFEILLHVFFDEPIVREGANQLNKTAWLENAAVQVWIPDIFRRYAFSNLCVEELKKLGCKEHYSSTNGCIFISNNTKNIIVVDKNDVSENYFLIWLMPNNQSNIKLGTIILG